MEQPASRHGIERNATKGEIMPYTVRFDPTSTSKQADIIPSATQRNDGVMTIAQVKKLDSLPVGPLPPPGAIDFAGFYGLTAGTGNPTSTDYAGTIAVRTAAGTGAVPFPRLGPTAVGSGITPLSATQFQIAVPGIYNVAWRVHTTEPGQLELCLNDTLLFETCMGNMNPTAGGHEIAGNVNIETTLADSILELVNPNGNSPALTITPADGSSTHANAQTLVITRIR
jgi:hypothetical protein